jgi:hypothetical protein
MHIWIIKEKEKKRNSEKKKIIYFGATSSWDFNSNFTEFLILLDIIKADGGLLDLSSPDLPMVVWASTSLYKIHCYLEYLLSLTNPKGNSESQANKQKMQSRLNLFPPQKFFLILNSFLLVAWSFSWPTWIEFYLLIYIFAHITLPENRYPQEEKKKARTWVYGWEGAFLSVQRWHSLFIVFLTVRIQRLAKSCCLQWESYILCRIQGLGKSAMHICKGPHFFLW